MIKSILKDISVILPNNWLAILYFILRHRYIPNFRRPVSFSEKLGYIKLYNRNPLRRVVVDRIKVRDYVKSKSDKCKLINLLWSGDQLSKGVWNMLPEKFVAKANHGSGMVRVFDKQVDSFNDLSELILKWMNTDYSRLGREWWYKGLNRYVLIEDFIGAGEEPPPDFKFFCFGGKVQFIQVDQDRFSGHFRNLYDRNWNEIDALLVRPRGCPISKPPSFDLASEVAEQLSKDFDFIRVDLYLVGDNIYFGELTNAPGNGFEKYKPRKMDFELGRFLPSRPDR